MAQRQHMYKQRLEHASIGKGARLGLKVQHLNDHGQVFLYAGRHYNDLCQSLGRIQVRRWARSRQRNYIYKRANSTKYYSSSGPYSSNKETATWMGRIYDSRDFAVPEKECARYLKAK